ncbi:uracil-DNA glycosylase [Herbaspirillum sp.]|uniref:uracil-DNA glycosylase n=1 Tax=Herbaspirillum sp. TaxID=1890675 RepID=UPI0025BD68FE|nr:uracil-DNA glycosylase [Herbaspirillum sp.]
MIELTNYVKRLREKFGAPWEFPDFDPLDGGRDAELLFLMEKPGPMTSTKGEKGSGLISRDNNDPTAEAIFDFMNQARIPRERTALWNTIPGWNGKIKIGKGERQQGIEELPHLIALLPKVKGVVLVGRQAQRAQSVITASNLMVFTSYHPSPKVRSINPHLWNAIPDRWASAFRAIQA